MLKYREQRFQLLLIIFLAVMSLLESCISDTAHLKTPQVNKKSLLFEWFYDYRKVADRFSLIQSDDPSLNFMQSEYYYFQGDDSNAFASLENVLKYGDYRYVKAAVNSMRSMYLSFDEMNTLVDMDSVNSDLYARFYFDIERVYWAMDLGESEKALEISRKIPLLRDMLVYPASSAGFVSLDKESMFEKDLKANKIENIALRKISISATDVLVAVDNYFSPLDNRKFVFYNSFNLDKDEEFFIVVESSGLFKFVIDGKDVAFLREKRAKISLSKGIHSFYLVFAPYQESDLTFSLLFYDKSGNTPKFLNIVKKFTGTAKVLSSDVRNISSPFDKYILLLADENSSQEDWEKFYFKFSGSKSLPLLYHLGGSLLKEKSSEDYVSFVRSLYDLYPVLGSRIEDDIFSYYYNNDNIDKMRQIYDKRKKREEKSFFDYLVLTDYNYKIRNYGLLRKFSEELVSKYNEYPISYIYAAEACEAVYNVGCEIDYLEALYDKRPGFNLMLDKLSNLYLQAGRLSGAEIIFEEYMQKKPDSLKGLLYGINVSFAQKKYKEALVYAKKALEINPEYSETLKITGDIYLALGNYNLAAEYFKKAYIANPSDVDVTLKLSDIRNISEDLFIKKNIISDADTLKTINEFNEKDIADSSAFSVIIDAGAIHILSPSFGVIRSRYTVKINNDEGIREFSSFRKESTIVSARIIRENGSIDSSIKADSEFIYPELKKGDVFDIVFDSELSADSWHEGVVGGWFFASSSNYVFKSEIIISVPESVRFYYDINFKEIIVEQTSDKFEKIYSFKAENMLMYPKEKSMNIASTAYPYLAYSCNGSWDEFSALQSSFIKSQQNGGDIVKQKVFSIVDRNVDEPLAEIEKLRNFVARDISYFYNDKGVFKIKPEKTSETLKSMRGDCKDKALLLKQMLNFVGIKAIYSLVKSRNRGPVYKKLPFMQFDHAVVYIPEQEGIDKGFFVDPVASYDNFMLINSSIEDTDAFVIDDTDSSYRFIKVKNNLKNRIRFIQKEDGLWHVEMFGASASTMRYNYMRTGDISWFKEIVGRISAGAVIKNETVKILSKSYDEPFIIEFAFVNEFYPRPVSFFFDTFIKSGKRNYDFVGYDRLGWIEFVYKNQCSGFYDKNIDNDLLEYKIKKSENGCLLEFKIKKGYLQKDEFNRAVKSVLDVFQKEKGADNG